MLIYRGISNDFNTALQIAVATGSTYFDRSKEVADRQYWYWIRIVSVNGTVGALIGPATAVAKPTIQQVIEQLSNKIDQGQLSQALKADLGRITLNAQDLIAEINNRIAASTALTQALQQVQAGLVQAVSLVNTEITQRTEGDSALAQQVSVVAAANASNTAAITAEALARVNANSALSLRVDGVSAVADGAASAITNIGKDTLISPVEKPALVTEYGVLTDEKDGIVAEATRYGITTEKTAYTDALTALAAYLATLTGWNVIPGEDVTIVPATFQTKWKNVYATRQTLLNKISEKAKTLIGTAQSAADTAQADATSALNTLADIASDSKLTASEKPVVVRDYSNLINEKDGLVAEATRYDITPEKDAYTVALTALTNYLDGLTGWNEIPGSAINIVGETFRSKFSAVYLTRQVLINKILERAKGLIESAQTKADQAAADISSTELAKAENPTTASTASAIAQKINNARVAANNASAAVQTIVDTKIGYSAVFPQENYSYVGALPAGTYAYPPTRPYDGDGYIVVYPESTYPAADYPEYAMNRMRIIDKVGVDNWNSGRVVSYNGLPDREELIWVEGMPLAQAIQTVQVLDANGYYATLKAGFVAQKLLNDGFKAQYTAQIDVNGLIGGFGIYGSTASNIIEAGFNVDRFWIGRTAENKVHPFMVDNDVVYINQAVIKDATINFAKMNMASIGGLSAIKSNLGQIDAGEIRFNHSSGPGTCIIIDSTTQSLRVFNNGVLRVKIGNLT